MKRFLWIVFVVVILWVLAFFWYKAKLPNIHLTWEEELQSLHFQESDGWHYINFYDINKEGWWFVLAFNNTFSEDPKKISLSLEQIEALEQLIVDYEIFKRDGFSKYNKTILDGTSRSLRVSYTGNIKISANGYMKRPKDKKGAYSALKALLNSWVNAENE